MVVAGKGQFQSKILTRAKSQQDFAVYQAALEWSLVDPIVIEGRGDFKSEYRWKDRLEPFHHQVQNLITFCRRLPVTLLADDVGLGKTISAGLVASELISRNRVSKILIVAPKLLGPQWQSELAHKFDIPAEFVTGSDLINANPDETGAVITTYHSARAHLEKIPEDRFDMLVLDEAHKLRNLYGVDPTPQVAKIFQRTLQQRRFRFVLMLTATPIQNRLWDIYSLVDLLSVARGHPNPFGSEGLFARRFIADSRETARSLRPEVRDEFRKIVYGYMSRVRRGDANLDFPERKIQLHKVEPTEDELALIDVIAKPIQKLNRLVQISILQALTSSPHALMAQLNNMAEKGTVPRQLALDVAAIVTQMRTSAKLAGLGQLVEKLRQQNPSSWRMVVFTGRRETQTTIQIFLEGLGLKVGVINGSSGSRNQETIARFRADPPDIRAIVSTEAGSEGVNLQVANVLINFDLPWNPMIVEQRIGRVQRLGSNHKNVIVYNVMLAGTFEEYIVGRLMTKLQMASDAIGDIESLLEASGVGADSDDGAGFDEKIRELVVSALAGKDMQAAAQKIEQSIDAAKKTLEQERENIDASLGAMDGYEYTGPRTPTLSPQQHSMDFEPFVRAAFEFLGGSVEEVGQGALKIRINGGNEYARLEERVDPDFVKFPFYAPGSPAFLRLVDKVTASGLHDVSTAENVARRNVNELSEDWVRTFGASTRSVDVRGTQRLFDGEAMAKVRATTAHDSYERLVPVACTPLEHSSNQNSDGGALRFDLLRDPATTGLNAAIVTEAALSEPNIVEFTRFYLERREQELAAAKGDARKQKKLEDEFTPRLETTLVALQGTVSQRLRVSVKYVLEGQEYNSQLVVEPEVAGVVEAPEMQRCTITGINAPTDCIGTCAISGKKALRHHLVRSQVSDRTALPEHGRTCGASDVTILEDEAGTCDVTKEIVDRRILKTCAVTGLKAVERLFGRCEVTQADVLRDHLQVSAASGKLYRSDQSLASSASGRAAHKTEFSICYVTRRPILMDEAERCEYTGQLLRHGILQECGVSGKKVMPDLLGTCSVTGKRAIRELLINSSVSGASLLLTEGVRSAYGKFCTPMEAKACQWSGIPAHPDDLRLCSLLGLQVHFRYLADASGRLALADELLAGVCRTTHNSEVWNDVAACVENATKERKCRIEAAQRSPDSLSLAVCAEVKSMFGLRTKYVIAVYSFVQRALIGRVAITKRDTSAGVNRMDRRSA